MDQKGKSPKNAKFQNAIGRLGQITNQALLKVNQQQKLIQQQIEAISGGESEDEQRKEASVITFEKTNDDTQEDSLENQESTR